MVLLPRKRSGPDDLAKLSAVTLAGLWKRLPIVLKVLIMEVVTTRLSAF